MEWYSKAFLKASLAWLVLGVTLGLCMAIDPPLAIYRLAHVHMNLLGFVSMMIAGVAYHVIPRFTGHSLYSKRLACAHVWIANIGLALFVSGFIAMPHGARGGVWLLGVGASLSALGMFAFAFNLWRTIDGPAARRASPVAAQSTTEPQRREERPRRALATLD